MAISNRFVSRVLVVCILLSTTAARAGEVTTFANVRYCCMHSKISASMQSSCGVEFDWSPWV